MSNIVQIRPMRRVRRTAHRVTLDLVPNHVMEKLFYAAITVGWAAEEGQYCSENPESEDRLRLLQEAVNEASNYTVKVEYDTQEPA